ncbi:hypothetical protein CO666_20450 [Rhizobium chutanense]|uniref:Uncharacterized protein n=1 Tax=Rhizobium chutanense TaxID=2035448 RepID=A0A2A6J8Q8_9HYPH|nr:hypothetical protein CO666_20450 [Rhizobium chutanense]
MHRVSVVDKTQALYGDVEKPPATVEKSSVSIACGRRQTPTAVAGRFQPLLGAEAARPYDFGVDVAK